MPPMRGDILYIYIISQVLLLVFIVILNRINWTFQNAGVESLAKVKDKMSVLKYIKGH